MAHSLFFMFYHRNASRKTWESFFKLFFIFCPTCQDKQKQTSWRILSFVKTNSSVHQADFSHGFRSHILAFQSLTRVYIEVCSQPLHPIHPPMEWAFLRYGFYWRWRGWRVRKPSIMYIERLLIIESFRTKDSGDKSIYRITTTVCTSIQDYLSLCILTKISNEKTFYFSLRFPDAIHQLHGGNIRYPQLHSF